MAIPDSWDEDPLTCFRGFVFSLDFVDQVKRRPRHGKLATLSSESAKIYMYMFGSFAEWMSKAQKRFSEITHEDLHRFVTRTNDGHPALNSKIAFHYLRLLERCYAQLGAEPNPASLAISAAVRQNEVARNAPTVALTDEQQARFLAVVLAPFEDETSQAAWKRRRDRAMQTLMALSGLRVAEVIGMKISEIGRQPRLDGSLELDLTPEGKHPTSYKHTALLRQAGVPTLLAWLEERDLLKIPGDLLFPANVRGEVLNKATVYRQVRATFLEADIKISRTGGRSLRNTFAHQHVLEGTPPAELAQLLGLAEPRSAEAYQYVRRGAQI